MDNPGANEAAGRLAEAIDDFLGDIEKKFKGISDEILTKCESTYSALHYILWWNDMTEKKETFVPC